MYAASSSVSFELIPINTTHPLPMEFTFSGGGCEGCEGGKE